MPLIATHEFLETRDKHDRVYKGIVIDNNDPKKIGRVKVFVKGILEGTADSLPWCTPEFPALNGGSPSQMSFSVPELGAMVSIVFQGGNPYVPIYKGTWVGETMSVDQLFGEDYPNTSGSIDPSGSFVRTNSFQDYKEFHHSSGSMVRFNHTGDIEIVTPKNLLMRVDGDFLMNNNYWKSGGGGLGNVIEEILYAVIEGPYVQGLLDIVALLPEDVSIEGFAKDLENLVKFANSLPTLDPELIGISDLLALLENKANIYKAFKAFNGVEGLVNLLFSYFGLFGVWNLAWLGYSEDILTATVYSLESPSNLKLVLLGKSSDLQDILGYPPSQATPDQARAVKEAQSKVTKDVIEKMIVGFTALATISPILLSSSKLKATLDTIGTDNPRLVLASLPEELNAFVMTTINDTYTKLMEAVVDINPRSQVAFLDRFGISKYFSNSFASTEMVRGVVKELLEAGVDRYELGMNGHIVGRAILQDQQTREDSIEEAQKMFKDPAIANILKQRQISNLRERLDRIDEEYGPDDPEYDEEKKYLCSLTSLVISLVTQEFHKERIMQFIDELDLDYPVAEYTETDPNGVEIRKIRYIGTGQVQGFLFDVYNMRNDPDTLGEGDTEGTGDDDGIISLAEDLENMGEGTPGKGLLIPGSVLCYMGKAIGDLCRASAFAHEAKLFLGEDLAKQLDNFPSGEEKKEGDTADKSLLKILADVYQWSIAATIAGLSDRMNENVLAQEMNTFLVGLDPHGLFRNVVPYKYIEVFLRNFISIPARSRASSAYGANLHQILATGMIDLVFEDIKKKLTDIEMYVYKTVPDPNLPPPKFGEPSESLSEGPYYPKTYWYSIIFGCPMTDSQPGYSTMYKRSRSLDLISERMVRLGKWYRSSNLQYVENTKGTGIDSNEVTIEDVNLLKEEKTQDVE